MILIINADDFGLDENVTMSICESMNKGLCSNTTLMVNMPYSAQAVRLANENNFFHKVGLHLNFTQGKPLTDDIRQIRIFCDKNGMFYNMPSRSNIKTRLWIDKKYQPAVKKEMEAQIQKYIDFGLPQMHMDSHHHIHTDYAMLILLKGLLKKYGFRSLRMSKNIGDVSIPKRIYKYLYNSIIPHTTDYFGTLEEYLSVQDVLMNKDGICEIMVHPKYKNNILTDEGKVFEKQVECIKNPNLISY